MRREVWAAQNMEVAKPPGGTLVHPGARHRRYTGLAGSSPAARAGGHWAALTAAGWRGRSWEGAWLAL